LQKLAEGLDQLEIENVSLLRSDSNWGEFLQHQDPINAESLSGCDSGFIGEYIMGYLILDALLVAYEFPRHPLWQNLPPTHTYRPTGSMKKLTDSFTGWKTFIQDFLQDLSKNLASKDSNLEENASLIPLAAGPLTSVHHNTTRRVFELACRYTKITRSAKVLSHIYFVVFVVLAFHPVSWASSSQHHQTKS
jgi:hypothetical protein